MRTEKAIQKKIEIGEETSKKLLDYLKENPNKTIYELSKTFDWKVGKVQKALCRIGDNVAFKEYVEKGKFKKKYYVVLKS
jgi:predicted HTH transcriptional regulator